MVEGDALEELCARSMQRGLPPELRCELDLLCREIEARHGGVLAILLYGSCLRGGQLEGVPDFIVIVESYDAAYPARRLRAANRWLPPNVFPLFSDRAESGALRAKYAVVSLEDLIRDTSPGSAHCFLWARLCQPMALLAAKQDATRDALARCGARAIETMVSMALPQLVATEPPGARGTLRVEPEALWAEAFRQTYRAEWRFEPRLRHRELLADDPDYYRCATEGALKRLGSRGLLEHRGDRVEPDPEWVRRSRRAWALRRPASKAIAAARLIKSALIFGDWVPYALWKMERHTGVRLEASAAQRRHPFLLGWPLIFRALRERLLR